MSAWISKSEVSELTGYSSRHIDRMVDAGTITSRQSSKTLRNGKREREYAVYSLPDDAQKKYFELSLARAASYQLPAISSTASSQWPAASGRISTPDGDGGRCAKVNPISRRTSVVTANVNADEAALRRSTNQSSIVSPDGNLQRGIFDHSPELARPDRVVLPGHLQEQANERYQAIAPLLEFARGVKQFPFSTLGGKTIRNLDQLAAHIAEEQQTSTRTIWRWYTRYKNGNSPALANRARSDRGQSRYFEDNPVLRSFAEKKYLSERLSIRMVHEALERECSTRRLDAPSYSTVRAYLASLPAALSSFAREGERQYHDRCEMYVLKDYSKKLANDIWVSDHMTHDVFVRNDGFFPDVADGAAIRPWLTAVTDYRTRKVLGFTWCANPSSDSIASAIRMALIQFGKPQECFYIDNGEDYKSIGRVNEISPELSGSLERLGIASQHCLVKHPQSKNIERWFRTLHERFDVLWRPFYSGRSAKDRPEECDEMLKEHNKLLKSGNAEQSPLPLASEFVQAAAFWIAQYNAHHAHTGEAMDGRTPDEVFNAQYPMEQRRLLNDGEVRALDILLRRREKRRVRNGGCIFINSHRYEPVDPASQAAMLLEIEHDVIVACDPANMGEAVACDLDGHYLATLQASKLMEHGPVSRDEVRSSMRQRRLVRRAIKGYVENLIAASYERGEQSELEILREGAGLAAKPMRVQRRRALPAVTLPKVASAPIGYDRVADSFFEED